MIDLLRSFVVFGDARNFTRAAKLLAVSQPALHERIRKLGDELGVTLYERRGRDLALTGDGERVLAYARDQTRRHDELVTSLRGGEPSRTVTLAAGEGAYLYLLGPALAAANVQPVVLGAPAMLEAIRAGRADLGVGVVDLLPRGVDAQPIVTTPLCVALPSRHPATRSKRLALADLRGETWILPPEGQLHRDLATRAIATAGAPPARVIDADGWPLMLRFVGLGFGVAIVNGVCAAPGVTLRPLAELGAVTYRLFSRRGATLSPDARALAAAIIALGAR
jgi:DNA-binding transcriptional LysR family regulator